MKTKGEGKMKKAIAMFSAALLAAAAGAGVRSWDLWRDTSGHVINAHGGGVMHDGGEYWWYGEHKVYGKAGNAAWVGVHAYSSKNLVDWEDRGIALAVSQDPESEIVAGCIIERPKVVRNAKTGNYVMFFHLELKGKGYSAAKTGIALANRPEGPFVLVRTLRPNGAMSRDMTVFVDDDGKAYHFFSSEDNRTMHVDELTEEHAHLRERRDGGAGGVQARRALLACRLGMLWMVAEHGAALPRQVSDRTVGAPRQSLPRKEPQQRDGSGADLGRTVHVRPARRREAGRVHRDVRHLASGQPDRQPLRLDARQVRRGWRTVLRVGP